MSKRINWDRVREVWREERINTGCSIPAFAKKHHLPLGSCKRHLRVSDVVQNGSKHSIPSIDSQKKPQSQNPETSKQHGKRDPSKGGAPAGNQNARKHGGYSKLINPEFLAMASATDHEADYVMARAHMMESIAYRQKLHERFMSLVSRIGNESDPLTDLEWDEYHGLKKDIANAERATRDWKMTQDYHLKMMTDDQRSKADTRLKTLAGDKLEIETGAGLDIDELLADLETSDEQPASSNA